MSDSRTAVRDRIFISYRRDDASGASGRLYDWTRIAFGRESVFRDSYSIGVGKWREKINDALARSAVCIAVIGPRWANAENLPRLHNVDDMVRHELSTALKSDGVTMVPTLVEGAEIPTVADLPVGLQSLFEVWNARRVTEEGWEDDTRRLIAEIAKTSGLPVGPDLDELIRDAGAAQRRVAELEQTLGLQAGQIEGLRRTVDELRSKLADAPAADRVTLAAAFAALARGDTLAAEDAFERAYETQHREADEKRRAKAESARNVANLALLRDVAKAVTFYRKALAADPAHLETLLLLGHALILVGDLAAAEGALSAALREAKSQDIPWGQLQALVGLGDVLKASKNLAAARKAYTKALGLAEQTLATNPYDALWQLGLSVSHDGIGDVLVALGDLGGALASYGKCLATRQTLAECQPQNRELQFWLSMSQNKIGDVLAAQGDLLGALSAHETGLAIGEALAECDPVNVLWQHGVFGSHNRIGDVCIKLGNWPRVNIAYSKCLEIAERLVARDPTNTAWQHDLALSYSKIGYALSERGALPGALDAYRRGLTVFEALAARDPSNTEWQRDVSISQNKIGDILSAQGALPEALDSFKKSLAIRDALTRRDPLNLQWRRDFSQSHNRIGDVLFTQGRFQVALDAFRRGLAAGEALAKRDPTNTELQRDLSISQNKIGNVLVAQRDESGALVSYRKCLAIREALAAQDPRNAQWQTDLSTSCGKLGTLEHGQSIAARRDYLIRGKAILKNLKSDSRLVPNQDRIEWFEQQLKQLPPV